MPRFVTEIPAGRPSLRKARRPLWKEGGLSNPNDEGPAGEEGPIIRRILAGDREAFARLVQAHQAGLFAKVYRWVGSREQAEEIAQETFLRAYRDLKNFRGDAKFSTWLFQIAVNRCRDFWRSRKRRPQESAAAEEAEGLADPEELPDVRLERLRKIDTLRRALETLPATYRDTVALRFLGDLSCQEIADATGLGMSNVKMRLMRGIEKLKKKLQEEPGI